MMTIDHILIRAAKAASLDLRSYSGRGMYGKQCVGIDTDKGEAQTIAALIRGCRDVSRDESDLSTLLEHIEDTETDSMGRGIIMYWPNIEAPDDADENDDAVECDSCGAPSDECECAAVAPVQP